jgi:hypothetical protein
MAVACFPNLRRLRQIRRRVISLEITVQLVLALNTSRLDYCHSTLAGLPQTTIQLLRGVQNAAGRLMLSLDCDREHVTPALIELHWLPVNEAEYNICCVLLCMPSTTGGVHIILPTRFRPLPYGQYALVCGLLTEVVI